MEFYPVQSIQQSRDFLLQWCNLRDNPSDLILSDLNCFAEWSSLPARRGNEVSGVAYTKDWEDNLSLMRQSLSDELQSHVQFQHECRDGCLLVITETWLSWPLMGLVCPWWVWCAHVAHGMDVDQEIEWSSSVHVEVSEFGQDIEPQIAPVVPSVCNTHNEQVA